MATQPSFVEYVAEQAGLGDRLTTKRMFGEYGLYIDGKVVAFACDDSLFVKPADATAGLCADLPRRPPYPGAKPYPVADELLDDSDALRRLLLATFEAVPDAKVKRVKGSESGAGESKTAANAGKPAKSGKASKTAGTSKTVKASKTAGTSKAPKAATTAEPRKTTGTAKASKAPQTKTRAASATSPKRATKTTSS